MISRIALPLLALFAVAAPARAADFVYPISGRLTSTYYSQRSYGYHGALDIAGPSRGAVGAARAGTVSFAGWNGGYGNLVIVDHEAGYQTYYAHLSGFAVSRGQRVAVGQTIGYEGSTGNSTGPHVHFEIRRYGTKQYLPGSSGNQVSKGAGVAYTYAGLGSSTSTSTSGIAGVRVAASALNVRTGPGTGYATMGLVYSGQVYVSNASEGGWHRIWFDGRQGWSSGSYLARAVGAEGRQVTASGLNVRTGPGTGYTSVAVVPRGQVYARAGASGDWIQIWFGGALRWFHGGYTNRTGL